MYFCTCKALVLYYAPSPGPDSQLTCFASTKVQILTPAELRQIHLSNPVSHCFFTCVFFSSLYVANVYLISCFVCEGVGVGVGVCVGACVRGCVAPRKIISNTIILVRHFAPIF